MEWLVLLKVLKEVVSVGVIILQAGGWLGPPPDTVELAPAPSVFAGEKLLQCWSVEKVPEEEERYQVGQVVCEQEAGHFFFLTPGEKTPEDD